MTDWIDNATEAAARYQFLEDHKELADAIAKILRKHKGEKTAYDKIIIDLIGCLDQHNTHIYDMIDSQIQFHQEAASEGERYGSDMSSIRGAIMGLRMLQRALGR